MYVDTHEELSFDRRVPSELYVQQLLEQQQHTAAKGKLSKIQKYRVNIPTKEKTETASKLAKVRHPLDDASVDETNENNCSEDDYDSLDDVSYSSCSTSPEQFREPSFLQGYVLNSPSQCDLSLGSSIPSTRSSLSLLSLNGSALIPSSLASSPSTTTALFTTSSSTTPIISRIDADTTAISSPLLTPSSSPLSTFVSFENTSRCERTKLPKLSRSSSTECLSKVLHKYQSKQSLYSNLTESIKSIRERLVTRALADFEVDTHAVTEKELPAANTEELPAQELITFFEAKHDHDTTSQEHIKPSFKNRDHRINAQFLRLYAYDYNARINSKTLPNSLSQEDLMIIILNNPHLKSFHSRHNIYHISNLSRQKLWNSVVLKPRHDKSPEESVDSEDYICVADDSSVSSHASLTRKNSKYLPWDLKPSIKPAGILPRGKWVFNGKAPNSGVSKTQFTVKGWCNSRWVAKTALD
ncbi:hypothetical protein KGF57_005051 [Candida theae]|uniref:Uncharacterized protein n=1 Tax=Candida theae TaxID=1198502 RepID=A0AAD5FWJ7_9ASCO|nr:uncharacterized protein KGF57_005051 [Candida theae]KAI5948988.1 hypothetical protein KGF57_005051 [Candida theae]